MPPSGKTVSRLLGLLYEASASPEQWPGFLAALSECSHAESAAFVLVDPQNRCSFVVNSGFDPAYQRGYSEYYFQHDVVLDRFVAASKLHGSWIGTSKSVISDADFRRTIVLNEIAKPMGQIHQIGATFDQLDGGLEGGLTMLRGEHPGPFGRETVALLKLLAPHLERALNTHRMLSLARSENCELEQTVEALDIAVLSVNAEGRVVRISAAAWRILDRRNGIALAGGFLRASLAGEQARLAAMIAGATATGARRGLELAQLCPTENAPESGNDPLWSPPAGGAMMVSRSAPSRPLQLVVTPFHSDAILLHDRPAALVFLSDPDAQPASRASALSSLYGLTPAECRLADLLVEGRDLAAAAAAMRMATATARFHLKAVFRKTGTRRQAELVRLVLGLPGKCMEQARGVSA